MKLKKFKQKKFMRKVVTILIRVMKIKVKSEKRNIIGK